MTHTLLAQRPDIGPVIDPMRRDLVSLPVTREKGNPTIHPFAYQNVARGIAVGRFAIDLVFELERFTQRIESAAANNREHQLTFSGSA